MAGILCAMVAGSFVAPAALYPAMYHISISGYVADYNVYNDLIAKGWNGTTRVDVAIVVNADGILYASSTGTYGFDTGAAAGYPAGSTIHLVNNGLILGRGGAGGNSIVIVYPYIPATLTSTAGSPGGPAIHAQYAITIVNNGTIGGGGGGGGAGGYGIYRTNPSGYAVTGGGGGGGICSGVGGYTQASPGTTRGDYGSTGTITTPGTGGNSNTAFGGKGGNGGSYGAAGDAGVNGVDYNQPDVSFTTVIVAGAGGAAGNCTVGNANITWTITGIRAGVLG